MSAAPPWLDQRLVFFTGKGGTGKSTIAAAAALFAAQRGKRVLLIDVDAKQTIATLFEHRAVGFEPEMLQSGIAAIAMDTEKSLREYLKLNLRVPIVGRIGPLARMFDFVATAAPGVKEILTIGKIMWEVREAVAGRADHDIVIVDAVASGHVIAQLNAPQTIRDLADVGPLRNQTDWMIELITDPGVTSINVVTTPEEMPVVETIELIDRLRSETNAPLGAVVVNRVLPELFTRDDEVRFIELCEPDALRALGAVAGVGVEAVVAGARQAVTMRRSRVEHLEALRDRIDLPLLYVPHQFGSLHGVRTLTIIAEALADELGV